ncbi:hypothetical protein GCM10009347_27930 [Shewanella algicola]|uniref:Twin-arginine translocation signal domain-containing protein n=1 Tax=Shewanella algicola TaxID=640633 RepID=A0A9X2CEN4_9GAMM|nr:reductive dehalogenase domain-containing protein [Shewanella algicola]MCL1106586.1 twin-arginine translocation signal domain-containing protein [Shewanella algicola]GGP59985.1 hypothetical protein GCM10009347_27930 [Shewanella algicola]
MNKPKFDDSTSQPMVGRRDFMKMLGVGAGAVGAISIGGKVFANMDEAIASPYGDRNLPWWVKEVDEPTIEIDWENMEVFPGVHKTLFNPNAWDKPEEWKEARDQNIISTTEKVRNNVVVELAGHFNKGI